MAKPKKIPEAVKRAMEGQGIRIPQVAELVAHFLAAAGGPKMLAKMLMEEYVRARSGSIIRQRILESVLRMLTVANQTVNVTEEVDLLTNEDLQAELERLVWEAAGGEEEAEEKEHARGDAGKAPVDTKPGGAAASRRKRADVD